MTGREMRVSGLIRLPLLLFMLSAVLHAQPPQASSGNQIVNQMVQVESAAIKNRRRFLYRREVRSARTKGHLWDELVVETPEGRMHRLVSQDGKPLSDDQKRAEDNRITNLVNHPDDFRREAQARKDDETRMAELLTELPHAFLFTVDGSDSGCTRIAFRPNPSFQEHTYQDRIIHAMSGTLLVRLRDMRLCAIDAHLDHKVQFGFGLLGEVSDGSHFSFVREEMVPGQWKTTKINIHVNGSLLFLKSFSRDEDSTHCGFQPVGDHLTVAEAATIVRSHTF
jgi:hypothetical protein